MEEEILDSADARTLKVNKHESVGRATHHPTFRIEKDEQFVIPLWPVIILLVITLATAIALEFLPILGNGFLDNLHLQNFSLHRRASVESGSLDHDLKFAIYGKSKTEEHLKHVFKVFQKSGYKRVSVDQDWDILWAHDYPFMVMPNLKNLQQHQRVNHIPGCGYITNKVDLSTTPLPFIPKSFKLPDQYDDFLRYAAANPGAIFVQKNNEHRNIEIKHSHEVDFNSTDSFVQELVQNPLLVGGYKFDIGVYVLITSVDPLRIYIYTGDVLFRYCAVEYHPFDPNHVEKYVVGDDYLPTWEHPSLREYYVQYSGSMRASFDAYMRHKSQDPSIIWLQVEDLIRRTVQAKESDIARIGRSYKVYNFFELLRFDMIIDDQLRVYLMEVNMSPNLSSAHFHQNSLLYDQIIFNVFNLLGIASTVNWVIFKRSSDETKEMIASDKNLATYVDICSEYNCEMNCNMHTCQLCLPCLSGSQYDLLKEAYREQLHKGDMKRIFPKPIFDLDDYDIEEEVKNLTKTNAWLSRWYYGKCLYDRSWCV